MRVSQDGILAADSLQNSLVAAADHFEQMPFWEGMKHDCML
jgi:hypothetical protein